MLTAFQEQLYRAIQSRGTVQSLFRLVRDEQLDYAYSHQCLQRLEAENLVTVFRKGPGCPLVIAANPVPFSCPGKPQTANHEEGAE